jgi:hypothetical protein
MWVSARSPRRSVVPTTRLESARHGPKAARDMSRRADTRAPRRSEDRGGCQRHAEVDSPSSRCSTRFIDGGELPANWPKPVRVPPAHPRFVPPDERLVSPGHRGAPSRLPDRAEARAFRHAGAGCSAAPSGPSRSSSLPPRWSGVPVDRPAPGGDGRGRDSRRTRFLVAGFHTRFVPPSPFSTTLAVYSSPRPPTCFSRSRSWSLDPEEQYLVEVPRGVPIRRPALLEIPSKAAVSHRAANRRSDPESDPLPASREA